MLAVAGSQTRPSRLRQVQGPARHHTATENGSWDLCPGFAGLPRPHVLHRARALLAFWSLRSEPDGEQHTSWRSGKQAWGLGSWEPRWERSEGWARYLQQGQDPRETDVTAAERGAGNKDAGLVEHLVPSMRAGRRKQPLSSVAAATPRP